MTLESLVADATAAIAAGSRVTLVFKSWHKMPPKFPRGEFLCENQGGERCYSYEPRKVLAWAVWAMSQGSENG